MTNNNILDFIWSMFTQVINLASDIKIYNDNGISVSVLQFFVALTILFIVLSALINFVRAQSVENVGHVKTAAAHVKNWRNTAKELDNYNSNDIMGWMFD